MSSPSFSDELRQNVQFALILRQFDLVAPIPRENEFVAGGSIARNR